MSTAPEARTAYTRYVLAHGEDGTKGHGTKPGALEVIQSFIRKVTMEYMVDRLCITPPDHHSEIAKTNRAISGSNLD